MEKLIYVLAEPMLDADGLRAELVEREVAAVLRRASRGPLVVHVDDSSEEIRSAAPARVSKTFEPIAAAVHLWLDSIDARGAAEEALRSLGGELWGYLVTESVPQPAERSWADGERRPGVCQLGMNPKPDGVSDEDFYHHWQIVHSEMSFRLHPLRRSYVRNAVARSLTPEAPPHRAIVLEHFDRDVFVDDARYFGSPAVLQEMIEHLPTFYPFDTGVTGPMSEYAFGERSSRISSR